MTDTAGSIAGTILERFSEKGLLQRMSTWAMTVCSIAVSAIPPFNAG